jgi:murein DD-endopeptidase MepM/ murein hydrolase activator NlpD
VRKGNLGSGLDRRASGKWPGKAFLLSLGLLGGLTALGYVFLAQGIADQFPFSCNLPASPVQGALKEPSCPAAQELPTNGNGALAEGSMEMTDVAGPGDTLYLILSSNLSDDSMTTKVASSLASRIKASLNKPFDANTPLNESASYTITVDRNGDFLKAVLELDPAHVFHAIRDGDEIRSWKEDVVLDFKTETICFVLENNVIDSVDKAGEGIELARKLTNVFWWDIDFHSELVKGDVCKVLFERRYADDRPLGYGRILGTVYQGQKTGEKTAILFNKTYYDKNGVELRKDFLRSPLASLRVTSRFGMRYHPIHRVTCRHDGVDYGAPAGDPVSSIARGTVIFSGWKNGYGNYVCIRHDNGYESRYGHLKRIFVRKGERIAQRHKIGLVGQTGDATGPHLHFEFLAKGKHQDPLKEFKKRLVTSIRTVPGPLKARFTSVAQERLLSLGNLTAAQRAAEPSSTSVR